MRILLAVDGSDSSYEAARALQHLARPERVIILHVVDVQPPALQMMMPDAALELSASVESHMRKEGERVLAHMESFLPSNAGAVSKRLETGSPAELIVNVAGDARVDLIVMGARGLGPVKELVLGSVSHRVATHAPCHVLVVNRPLHSLRKILLAVEGPADGESAGRFFDTKPFNEPVDIRVVTALHLPKEIFVGDREQARLRTKALEWSQKVAESTVSRLASTQHRVNGVVREGPPGTAILQEASEAEADLIVMGSRGRGGVTRFLLGSVSHAVLHRATCPVLIIRLGEVAPV